MVEGTLSLFVIINQNYGYGIVRRLSKKGRLDGYIEGREDVMSRGRYDLSKPTTLTNSKGGYSRASLCSWSWCKGDYEVE